MGKCFFQGQRTTSFAELRIHGESELRSFLVSLRQQTTVNSQQSISLILQVNETTSFAELRNHGESEFYLLFFNLSLTFAVIVTRILLIRIQS